MADLPDLDKNQISFIAYWNATDHGVTSIAPDEALSAGSIQEYTLYDNGWEGTYTLENQRDARVRVKNDGWIVAYLDRSATYALDTPNRDDIKGPWDVLGNWYPSGAASITNSALHQAIDSLRSELSNSGDMAYSESDVGLYDYRNTSATTLTVLEATRTGESAGDINISPTFLYTSGTSRHTHTTIGGIEREYSDYESDVNFEGKVLAEGVVNNSNDKYGVIDTLADGLAPSAETEYEGYVFVEQYAPATTASLVQFVSWE